MISVTFEPIKLALWKKRELNQRAKNPEGKWVPTGGKEEKTEYTFRDEFGETIVLLGDNTFRQYEGQEGEITLGIRYNEFERKSVLSLKDFRPL